MKRLWTEDKVTHKGRFFTVNDAGIGVAPNGSFVHSGRVDVDYAHKKGMLVVDHTFDHLVLKHEMHISDTFSILGEMKQQRR